MNKIDFSDDWVDKSLPYISISQILGLLSEPFDKDGVAQKTFDKNFFLYSTPSFPVVCCLTNECGDNTHTPLLNSGFLV